MYRVMIVDDEFFIRKSFKNRINWENYDMDIVGEAANGEEAYHMIPECQPDLMFVDIKMPVLDGFDLAALLVDEYPDINIIIISAYSDFQYAKAAIEKGVFDYLLKPLDEVEVDQTLNRLLVKMKEQKSRDKVLNLHKFNERPCNGQEVCCFALFDPNDRENKQIQNFLRWITCHDKVMRISGHNTALYQVFCIYGTKLNQDEIRKILQQKINELGVDKTIIGISQIFHSPAINQEDLRYLIAQAVEASKEGLFVSYASVFIWSEKEKNKNEQSPYHSEKIEIARRAISKKDYTEAGQAIISYLNSFNWNEFQDSITIETIVGIILELLFKAGWDTGTLSKVRVYTNEFQKPNYLLLFDNAEDVKNSLCKLVESLMEEMSSEDSSDLVQRIAQYIEENYSGSLQMEDIEKQFFMSQSSLLLAFKKKKNMTISSYIEAVRMEKAKELLASGIYNVQAAAEAVGYLDANYFCKVFKRYAGVTPSKYRMKS